jgi:hypothetical protein
MYWTWSVSGVIVTKLVGRSSVFSFRPTVVNDEGL